MAAGRGYVRPDSATTGRWRNSHKAALQLLADARLRRNDRMTNVGTVTALVIAVTGVKAVSIAL